MLACRSRWIDGSATFTTVLSSMIMNSAKHMAASVHHLRLPSWRRMRSGMALRLSVVGDLAAREDRLERLVEQRALLVRKRRDELLDAREAGPDQLLDQVVAGVGQGQPLHAAVLEILRPVDQLT